MRLGARNSGNSIRPWAARLLTDAPCWKLEAALKQAETRRQQLAATPDCPTKHTLLAREEWLIRCIGEELARRPSP